MKMLGLFVLMGEKRKRNTVPRKPARNRVMDGASLGGLRKIFPSFIVWGKQHQPL